MASPSADWESRCIGQSAVSHRCRPVPAEEYPESLTQPETLRDTRDDPGQRFGQSAHLPRTRLSCCQSSRSPRRRRRIRSDPCGCVPRRLGHGSGHGGGECVHYSRSERLQRSSTPGRPASANTVRERVATTERASRNVICDTPDGPDRLLVYRIDAPACVRGKCGWVLAAVPGEQRFAISSVRRPPCSSTRASRGTPVSGSRARRWRSSPVRHRSFPGRGSRSRRRPGSRA